MRKLSFLQNTAVLVVSNLITGTLGLIFTIILSNEIGAHGVGLYSMVIPVYSLFTCLSCGGTVTALSKIIAEKNSLQDRKGLYKTISVSIAFFMFWTALIAIAAVLSANFISKSLLKDSRTYLAVLSFIPALIFVSIGSVLKGYFYGMQNTTFPALIDVIEKCIRIAVLAAVVIRLKEYGLNWQVAGAVFAMTSGEFSSTALLYIFYKKSHNAHDRLEGQGDNSLQIIADVLKISLPLCFNGLVANISGSIIAAMVPRRLQAAGYAPETSIAMLGKVAGMSMNIVMFPGIILGAIATVLVPVISEASASRSTLNINHRISQTIKLTAAIAAASAAIFFTLPEELGRIFYQRGDLGNIIYSLSFGIIFIYIESTLCGILNGLGRQKVLLRNTVIMALIDIVTLYIFIGMPEINVYGYSINFVVSPLAGCILNYLDIHKVTGYSMDFSNILFYPAALAAVDVIIITILKNIVYNIVPGTNAAALVLVGTGYGAFTLMYFIFKNDRKNKV